ncbi:aminotransferase class I/II-fold pyridoxal phosphate-dependent enzyme [Metabacillus sp. KIGAM252]|uniref:Aminotransferase class I/II-fold pyridoxal phosphate-dependent enzyme n=1 Tax=Metabacillus flavus TaxID=2823519 RepID=A0ABS5LGF3_9BACI|nr:aminotransferase class I/II-fold pyridoxal phosphate-dependent enzyme [Metabacillus flavus]MBS2969653.1 aminotransferase class I/II-fold pyridoxal phosphate-dependent enzyme [Metabacillus flavus]
MKQAIQQKRIYLSPPHMSGKELDYINEAFETNWIAPLGPNVDAFEKELAQKVGVRAAAAVSSGTAAIHLALILLGVEKGDTVFCSTLTFVATANPILYQGAEPVFIDSEPETWNMSPHALERALKEAADAGKLPKAVIVVNLYGQSAKMDELLALCNLYDVPMVEDAAESLGSTYKGKASGTFGYFGIYSFNGNKIITTSGGGMLVSDDEAAIEKARFLATQARDKALHYQHSSLGFNYRMSNILAGVGRAQLQVLEERVAQRRQIFKKYKQDLASNSGIRFIQEQKDTSTNRWLTVISIDEQLAGISLGTLLHALIQNNIEARPVWKPLHLQPLFKHVRFYPHDIGNCVSTDQFENGICLPSGSNLTEHDMDRITSCILSAASL